MSDGAEEAVGVERGEADPEPLRHSAHWSEALGGISLGAVLMGGLTLAMLVAAAPRPRWGAPRTSELVRQERLAQIEAAISQENERDDQS
jgi:hypothetical protein